MVISPKTQALTSQFYEWEILGRGWIYSPEPIDLEPPFTPFFGHYLSQKPIFDDGKRHTLLSAIASVFKTGKTIQSIPEFPEVTYEPHPYIGTNELSVLKLHFPKNYKGGRIENEQFLTMLSYCTQPISFEIIGSNKHISIQFVCRKDDTAYIRSQAAMYFKGVVVKEIEANSEDLLLYDSPYATVDFGYGEEFMRPLGDLKSSPTDPYTGLFSILEHLNEGEQVVFQVLFNGMLNHWESSVLRAVSDKKGGPFFEDAPEMLPLTKEKLSAPLCTATIRLCAQSDTTRASAALLEKLCFLLITNTRSHFNALLPLADEDYTAGQRMVDIALRQSHRTGMIVNVKELAGFVHLPSENLISRKLLGDERKTKAAPQIAEGHKLQLGINEHNGATTEVSLSNEQRLKHTHIIGATGTGKSTLLHSMICQDIAHGEGVTVLDPHGDLIDSILNCIQVERVNDVIIFDPSDADYSIGFNILKAHSDIEKEVLASDLVSAFRKLSTSWGDQMNAVFANAVLAFLESTQGGSLIDLRRFLIEKEFRNSFLQTIPDPSIKYYWHKEYPLLKTNSVGPILTRLDSFLRPRLIRNMVAQPQGLDFEAILNQRKIVLVKLSQGLIGSENSYLLGSLIVSKIHQAALARQASAHRPDYFLYIDEFQHFITPSMSHMLSGARKYHLGLILAHQDLQQIQKTDSELLYGILSNAGTRICFRVGDSDAKKIAEGLSFFEPPDLQNLSRGEAIVRIEKPEYDFSLSTVPYSLPSDIQAEKEEIIAHSRSVYGTERSKVEAMLAETLQEEPAVTIPEKKMEGRRISEKPSTYHKPIKQEQPIIEQEKIVQQFIQRKEETRHRYLQNLIKKVAESKGYRATIELPLPDGAGRVDVSLEGFNMKIAVEVSVTTGHTWESHNIEKCLSAGYNKVFLCCADVKDVEVMRKNLAKEFAEHTQIHIGTPDELFLSLDEPQMAPLQSAQVVKGYRVNVEYNALSTEDMKRKRESVARVISEAMKKMKK